MCFSILHARLIVCQQQNVIRRGAERTRYKSVHEEMMSYNVKICDEGEEDIVKNRGKICHLYRECEFELHFTGWEQHITFLREFSSV